MGPISFPLKALVGLVAPCGLSILTDVIKCGATSATAADSLDGVPPREAPSVSSGSAALSPSR